MFWLCILKYFSNCFNTVIGNVYLGMVGFNSQSVQMYHDNFLLDVHHCGQVRSLVWCLPVPTVKLSCLNTSCVGWRHTYEQVVIIVTLNNAHLSF